MEQPRDRLLRYLDDARAAEVGVADTLEGFIKACNNDTIREAFQEHLMITKEHAVRLERRLRELGGEPSGGKGFFNSLMSRVADVMHGAHDDYDKATQDVIKAYATEHLEIGMYAALATFAEACGDRDTARLAEEIMAEEQRAADRLRPLIATASAQTFTAAVEKAA